MLHSDKREVVQVSSQAFNAEENVEDVSRTTVNRCSAEGAECCQPQTAAEKEMVFKRYKLEDRMAGYDMISD